MFKNPQNCHFYFDQFKSCLCRCSFQCLDSLPATLRKTMLTSIIKQHEKAQEKLPWKIWYSSFVPFKKTWTSLYFQFKVFFPSISGQLRDKKSQRLMNPKLWVALSGGRVVVFDAASWSMLQDCIQVEESLVVRPDWFCTKIYIWRSWKQI